MLGQRDGAQPAVAGIGLRGNEFAQLQAVDDALDGGRIEIDQAPQLVLRTGADFKSLASAANCVCVSLSAICDMKIAV